MARALPYPGHSWFFNHHAPCYEADTFLTVLRIAREHHGQAGVGDQITSGMADSNLLTLNVRRDTGKAESWRDYQQAFAEIGAIYSTMVTRGKIIVAPLAMALLDGEIDYPQFLTIQALGYQYPNGLKRTVQRNLRIKLKGTRYAGLRTLIDVQLEAGVRLKPFLLLFQVMRKLVDLGASPFLTREEMQRFLVYEKDNSNASGVARRVLGFRQGRKPAPPPAGDTRNFNDIIAFLGKTSVFMEVEVPRALALKESDPQFLQRVDDLIATEAQRCYDFTSGTLDQARLWFGYYGSEDRLERMVDLVELSKEIGMENLLDDISEARFLREPPSLVERGKRRVGPYIRPKLTETRRPGIITAIKRERARRGHKELVDLMEAKIRGLGAIPKDSDFVDLFAEHAGKKYYFEMKTVNRINILSQIRQGMGQLYEYSYRYEGMRRPENVELCLITNVKPKIPGCPWLVDYIVYDRGINVCWKQNDRFVCPPSCEGVLKPFLN